MRMGHMLRVESGYAGRMFHDIIECSASCLGRVYAMYARCVWGMRGGGTVTHTCVGVNMSGSRGVIHALSVI